MKRLKIRFLLSAFPGLTFVLLLLWHSSSNKWGQRRFTLFDDAMISMDYARTFAKSGQFVWFPGAPRVQGFTNPLWTLWMAFVHFVGFEGSTAALVVSLTGVALITWSAWIVHDLVIHALGQSKLASAALASGSIFFLFPLVFWTLRGMEVGLLAFLTLMLMRSVLHQDFSEGVKFSPAITVPALLGIATRFDFIVICVVVLSAAIYWSPQSKRLKIFISSGLYFVLCLATICGLQKWYWGSWLPNTYHLKMDGVDFFERITRGIVAGSKVSPIAIILIYLLISARRLTTPARHLVELSIAIFFAISAYAVYIGGDAWEDQMLNRFFAAALPLVAIAVTVSLTRSASRGECKLFMLLTVISSITTGATVNPFGISMRGAAMGFIITLIGLLFTVVSAQLERTTEHIWTSSIVLVTIIALITGIPLQRQIRQHNIFRADLNVYVTEVVENLKPTTRPNAVIATVWAGVPAYYSQRPMIDLLGKNDTRIAESRPHGEFFPGHNKWDYDYSIGQLLPDVIFQTFTRGLEKNLDHRIKQWGYKKFCVEAQPFPKKGVWYRTNSKLVNWSQLKPC